MPNFYRYIKGNRSYRFVLSTYRFRFFIPFLARLTLLLLRKKVILVFGMSRSGTSMLAQFLSLGQSCVYLHEPDVEVFKYAFGSRHFTQKKFWEFVNSDSQRLFKIHTITCTVLLSALRLPAQAICIKPIALLDVMSEISDALPEVKVVYISRHPAGRSDSILRQLKHDQDIEAISIEKMEELGRDWGSTHHRIKGWFETHPKWRWVRFEDLTRSPLSEFQKLYAEFGLAWDEKIEQEIEQKTTGQDGEFYEVKRNASQQADKWRRSLSEEQVEAIRRGTLPFETQLYETF